MRPRGLLSKWVKVVPWYYAERRQITRAEEFNRETAFQEAAEGVVEQYRDGLDIFAEK